MILEVARLNIRIAEAAAFEAAFAVAQNFLMSATGYVSHELHRCLETESGYIILVRWMKLEDHTIGFRQSPHYLEWKRLLHSFYEPPLLVEHYETVFPISAV